QDADLEYDPSDYQNCIDPILSGDAEVVYGSRRIEKSNKKYSGILYFIGGSLLTMFVNVLCFSWITDSACCYKTFRKETLLKYMPEGNSFTWDFQISVILLSNGIKIHEVPSKYYPRDKSEGKKINYKDFIKCIFAIIVARVKKR
ncbi:MAG: glycosyltransferase family 2 protein, partial [Nanoarchaeales archaeon]|nr:glycosyltransferase family 2 protein [Nanoarchaeales archaeon]